MSFAEAHKSTLGQPGTLIMGSGPWEIDSLDPTKGAEFSANPHWWGGKVPIRHISFAFFSSETSAALAFRAGEIDMDPNVGSPKTFSATSGAKLMATASCQNAMFSMNVSTPPWNDVHVRRAAAYALNRADIISAFGGYSAPIYTVIPPSQLQTIATSTQVSALLNSVPLYKYNVAQAKQQLAESAYPHGVSTTMLTDNYGSDSQVSQVIAAELDAVGIHVQLKSESYNAWSATESGPDSQRATAYTGWSGCLNPDPSSFMWALGTTNLQVGEWNTADYAPPVVNQLIAAGVAAASPAKRFDAYSELTRILQADEPYVGLFVTDVVLALSPKFTYAGFGPFYGAADYALGVRPAS
jgi:peptide/nickel transport system substrate-binding protein